MNKLSKTFYKFLGRYLLIGLSAFVLFYTFQNTIVGDFSQSATLPVLAEEGDDSGGSGAQQTSPLQASCSGSVNGQSVTWTANVSGGQAPYNISWYAAASGSGPSVTNNYSDAGTKTATADVTDAAGTFVRSGNCTAEVGSTGGGNNGGTPSLPGSPSNPDPNRCVLGGPGVAVYPGAAGSSEWCACAASNGDTGSLMNHRCPQAPQDQNPNQNEPSNPANNDVPRSQNPRQEADRCEDLATSSVCGQRAYNNCSEVRYDGNRAYYQCSASQNGQCQGRIYCASLDRNPSNNNNGNNNGGSAGAGSQSVRCPDGSIPSSVTPGQTQNTVVVNCNANNNTNNNTATGGAGGAGGAGGSATSGGSTSYSYAYAQGGSVTINGLGGNNNQQPVRYITAGNNNRVANVGVGRSANVAGIQYYQGVNQLPKTGLPILAWSALAFIPAGMRLRGFSKIKGEEQGNPNYLWESRQFHKS